MTGVGGHGHGHLLGLTQLNAPDNLLHIGLGLAIGLAGWFVRDQIPGRPVGDAPAVA